MNLTLVLSLSTSTRLKYHMGFLKFLDTTEYAATAVVLSKTI